MLLGNKSPLFFSSLERELCAFSGCHPPVSAQKDALSLCPLVTSETKYYDSFFKRKDNSDPHVSQTEPQVSNEDDSDESSGSSG